MAVCSTDGDIPTGIEDRSDGYPAYANTIVWHHRNISNIYILKKEENKIILIMKIPNKIISVHYKIYIEYDRPIPFLLEDLGASPSPSCYITFVLRKIRVY
jgi:hypothetical protein